MSTDDCQSRECIPLPSPRMLKARLPSPHESLVASGRDAIRAVLSGADPTRLIVIVGPCSIHDPKASIQYATRLARVAQATRRELLVVMRTYFEKPRTVVGWKGLVNDPLLDGSCDVHAGLAVSRSTLLQIGALGMLTGTEFLDPMVTPYLSDLVAWAGIGARTAESQTHRMMASGLPMPVGFKNGTDGTLHGAANAVAAARHGHAFLGVSEDGLTTVVRTKGNLYGHMVLRGGGGRSNYDSDTVARAAGLVRSSHLARGVMVDCSHDNSGRDPMKQRVVFQSVLDAFASGQQEIAGVMLESNLRPGKQAWSAGMNLEHGVSLTDACIGWDETERLLYAAAERIAGMHRSSARSEATAWA